MKCFTTEISQTTHHLQISSVQAHEQSEYITNFGRGANLVRTQIKRKQRVSRVDRRRQFMQIMSGMSRELTPRGSESIRLLAVLKFVLLVEQSWNCVHRSTRQVKNDGWGAAQLRCRHECGIPGQSTCRKWG